MSTANDIVVQAKQQRAEINAERPHGLARLIRRYSSWTANMKHIGQFRMSSDGIAIEMARNETRGTSGAVLCGFPDLDVAKWVQADEFQSWPLVSDYDDEKNRLLVTAETVVRGARGVGAFDVSQSVEAFVRLSTTSEMFTA